MKRVKKTKSLIVALAALTQTSVSQMADAMQNAMADMESELTGKSENTIVYTWDPSDGMLA